MFEKLDGFHDTIKATAADDLPSMAAPTLKDARVEAEKIGANIHPQNQLHKAGLAYGNMHNYAKQQMIKNGLKPLANHHSEQSKRCRTLDDTIPWDEQPP